jgi:hypothetical protein
MAPNYTPDDAASYTAGVDRSPAEVAALFLAAEPDGDPIAFLVGALGLDPAAAASAVAEADAFAAHVAETATPAELEAPLEVDDGEGDEAPAPGELTKVELLELAAELGVEVKATWGAARIREAIDAKTQG